MGDHGRSMGGPVRSVGVLGGQWGVLRGQWGVMGGQWVVLGGQWEVKGGSRQVTRRLQNAHCQCYSRAEALPVIFWLRYLSKIWVKWRPNKNTKCPIDAHCHRHCRRDPRIGRFWSGWSINGIMPFTKNFQKSEIMTSVYQRCSILWHMKNHLWHFTWIHIFKITAWFLQCMTVFKLHQIPFLHLIASSILWSSVQLFVSRHS